MGAVIKEGFPHTRWGWTASAYTCRNHSPVFPTRVGMDRCQPANSRKRAAFSPHVRGWTDCKEGESKSLDAFSPHAWGWTAIKPMIAMSRIVFPTRVGDGPAHSAWRRSGCTFSPHVWGWTGSLFCRLICPSVFSPHAWGWTDQVRFVELLSVFSPHAWGWTALLPKNRNPYPVFPTRVGMDRLDTMTQSVVR